MRTSDHHKFPISVLDLAPVVEGSTPAESFRRTLELAQHAEQLGYNRYWLAEHHNMPGVSSSATSLVIGHVAGGTSRIRVGSGGIMLPNHAPLQIAEQFGTLESLTRPHRPGSRPRSRLRPAGCSRASTSSVGGEARTSPSC